MVFAERVGKFASVVSLSLAERSRLGGDKAGPRAGYRPSAGLLPSAACGRSWVASAAKRAEPHISPLFPAVNGPAKGIGEGKREIQNTLTVRTLCLAGSVVGGRCLEPHCLSGASSSLQ